MSGFSIVPLTCANSGEAATVLADAFMTDEHIVAMLPNTRRRERLVALLHAQVIEMLTSGLGGGAAVDGANMVAVALWQAPMSNTSRVALLRNVPTYIRELGRRFPDALRTTISEQRHRPRIPHWYLAYLGTTPAARGRGIGTALVQHGVDNAFRDGVGAYLEASSRANVAYYKQFGFVEMGEIPSAGTSPTHAMWLPRAAEDRHTSSDPA